MIIPLDDQWYIDADGTNVVLTEKRVIQAREEGKGKGKAPNPENIGKERDVQHGFYGTITQAAQAYLNKGVATMPGMLSATQVVAAWADMTAKIERACKNLPRKGLADEPKPSMQLPQAGV